MTGSSIVRADHGPGRYMRFEARHDVRNLGLSLVEANVKQKRIWFRQHRYHARGEVALHGGRVGGYYLLSRGACALLDCAGQ